MSSVHSFLARDKFFERKSNLNSPIILSLTKHAIWQTLLFTCFKCKNIYARHALQQRMGLRLDYAEFITTLHFVDAMKLHDKKAT